LRGHLCDSTAFLFYFYYGSKSLFGPFSWTVCTRTVFTETVITGSPGLLLPIPRNRVSVDVNAQVTDGCHCHRFDCSPVATVTWSVCIVDASVDSSHTKGPRLYPDLTGVCLTSLSIWTFRRHIWNVWKTHQLACMNYT